MDDTLKELHICQLNLAQEVKRICDENEISYFLVDGSALGAYYLNDFIPWDDDMDIGMTYQNYIKFKTICKKELPPKYILRDFHDDETYGNVFGQLCDNSTICIQEGIAVSVGVFIDIHPFVCAYNNRFIRMLDYYFFKIFKILLLKKRNPDLGKGLKYDIFQYLSKCIPKKMLLKIIDNRMCKKISNSVYYSKLHGRHRDDYIKAENQNKLILIDFCGTEFMIQPDVKRMLDSIYGEYNPNLNEFNRHRYIDIQFNKK